MEQDARENLELRRYLLHELTAEEVLRVEARLFLESEYLEQLHAAEDDLVDEYVYEELSPDERERFKTHFLSDPERYKDLKIAEALKVYTSAESVMSSLPAEAEDRDVIPPPVRTLRVWTWGQAVRLSLAAAVVVIALGGLLLIFRAARRQNQPPPTQAQLPTPQGGVTPERQPGENGINNDAGNSNSRDAQGPQYAARNTRPQSANVNELVPTGNSSRPQRGGEQTSARRRNNVFALLLPVGPVRGEGAVKKVVVPSDAGVLHLRLALIGESGVRSYEATLRADDGRDIKTWAGLRAARLQSGRVVSIIVPVGLLNRGGYSVALTGTSSSDEVRVIGTYSFQIQK